MTEKKKHRNVDDKTNFFITRRVNLKYVSCFSDRSIIADKGGGGDRMNHEF